MRRTWGGSSSAHSTWCSKSSSASGNRASAGRGWHGSSTWHSEESGKERNDEEIMGCAGCDCGSGGCAGRLRAEERGEKGGSCRTETGGGGGNRRRCKWRPGGRDRGDRQPRTEVCRGCEDPDPWAHPPGL